MSAKGKEGAFMTNGSFASAPLQHRTGSPLGPDSFGETSSESYSSPSSPLHHRQESLESEEENNKDTDSHSDECSRCPVSDMFFTSQTAPEVSTVHPLSSTNHKPQMEPSYLETSEFPPLSFMPSLPMLPNGHPDGQSVMSEGKPPFGSLMVPLSLVSSGMDPEKGGVLTTFGMPSMALQSPVNVTVSSLDQRFKIASPHAQPGTEAAPGGDAVPTVPKKVAVRVLPSMSPGLSSYSSPTLPCQDLSSWSSAPATSLPHVDAPYAKHHSLSLPSGLPSAYTLPSPHVQTAVPPAAPTNSPGPPPSLSPALSHNTEATPYINPSASCVAGNQGTAQQNQQQALPSRQPTPPQQQQPVGCRACGCYNNCGSQGSGSGSGSAPCQAHLFFPNAQMAAAAARHMFSFPPSFFHLASICTNNYLAQAQTPHQANSAATLPPFFPTAPPPLHPSYLHPHSQTEVMSHMMGTPAGTSYSLQQPFGQRVYQQVYPNPLGLVPAAAALGGGGINKKNGIVSCYNCGASGHFAQDCSQPTMDSTQQGSFHLKYATSHLSEALDNAD